MNRSLPLVLAALLGGCTLNTDQVTPSEALVPAGSELTSVVNTMASDIATLKTELDAAETAISDLETAISDLETENTALRTTVTALEGALDDGAGGTIDVTTFDDRIGDLETEVGDAANNFAASRIDSLEGTVGTLQTDLGVVDGRVTVNEGAVTAIDGRVTTNEAAVASLEAAIGDSSSGLVFDVDGLMTDLTAAELDIGDLSSALDDGTGALLDAQTDLVWLLGADMTICVANDSGTPPAGSCDTVVTTGLLDALEQLDRYRIPAGVVATVLLADGTHSPGDEVVFHHPDGAHIQVLGEGMSTTFVNFGGVGGIVIADGTSLGLLGAMTLDGGGTNAIDGGGTNSIDGLVAAGSASLTVDSLTVQDFNGGVVIAGGRLTTAGGVWANGNGAHGFEVTHGGSLLALPNTVFADGNGGNGVWVQAAHARILGVESTNNTLVGVTGIKGATVLANNATLTGNKTGAVAYESSYVEASGSVASSSVAVSDGFNAAWNSVMLCLNCSGSVTRYGFDWGQSSIVIASGATITGAVADANGASVSDPSQFAN